MWLLGLFTNRFTWIVLAVLGIVAFIGVQQLRINHLKSSNEKYIAALDAAHGEIDATKALVKQWSQSYDILKDTVTAQNRTIAGLETEVAERMKKAKAALQQAEVAKIKANGLAKQIQQMEVAKDECTAMRQLIDAYVGGMR